MAPTWFAVRPVIPAPLPTNEVAVIIPVRFTLPVPVMSLLLTSKSPPSCGVVSDTISAMAPTWFAVRPVIPCPSPTNAVAVITPVELIFLTAVISSKSASIFPIANLVPADIDVVPTPNA